MEESNKPPQHRALIVEDDIAAVGVIREALSVVCPDLHPLEATTVEQAKHLSALNIIDLVVLDRMLGDSVDGLAYLRWLDALETPRPGVLVTSSLGSVQDHVLGLDAGADDYISKPFAFEELCARLRAVSRRLQSVRSAATVLFFGALELRTVSKVALVDGQVLTLQPKNFRLLQALVMRQGEWISRKALWQEVWTDYPNLAPQDAPINNAISRVRKALATIPGAPRIVSEDFGYRLVHG